MLPEQWHALLHKVARGGGGGGLDGEGEGSNRDLKMPSCGLFGKKDREEGVCGQGVEVGDQWAGGGEGGGGGTVLLDTRNIYESDIGRFECPGVETLQVIFF
jgi:hypothetical protein